MTTDLLQVITSDDHNLRNTPLDRLCANLSKDELLEWCQRLDKFRRESANLYQRVRALFFLYAIYRFHLPPRLKGAETGTIPFHGYEQLLARRFPEAIESFLQLQSSAGPTVTLTVQKGWVLARFFLAGLLLCLVWCAVVWIPRMAMEANRWKDD